MQNLITFIATALGIVVNIITILKEYNNHKYYIILAFISTIIIIGCAVWYMYHNVKPKTSNVNHIIETHGATNNSPVLKHIKGNVYYVNTNDSHNSIQQTNNVTTEDTNQKQLPADHETQSPHTQKQEKNTKSNTSKALFILAIATIFSALLCASTFISFPPFTPFATPIPSSPIITTHASVSPIPTTPSPTPFDFASWWNKSVSNAHCMLPNKNASVTVYPPGTLSYDKNNKEHRNYKNTYTNGNDKITITSIIKEEDSLAIQIEYPTPANPSKPGSIKFDALFNINTNEPPQEKITKQTTSVFWQPDDLDSKPSSDMSSKATTKEKRKKDTIAPGKTLYLLETDGEWQQVLYYDCNSWYIYWVYNKELEEQDKNSICTVKSQSTYARTKASTASSRIITTLYPGETYVIHGTKLNDSDGRLWYQIYTNGQLGYVSSNVVTVNNEQ